MYYWIFVSLDLSFPWSLYSWNSSSDICISGYLYPQGYLLYPWISVSLELCISGYLNPWISVSLDICISGYLNPWISVSLDLCIPGSLYPWISVSLDVCIPGYLYPWIKLYHWIYGSKKCENNIQFYCSSDIGTSKSKFKIFNQSFLLTIIRN